MHKLVICSIFCVIVSLHCSCSEKTSPKLIIEYTRSNWGDSIVYSCMDDRVHIQYFYLGVESFDAVLKLTPEQSNKLNGKLNNLQLKSLSSLYEIANLTDFPEIKVRLKLPDNPSKSVIIRGRNVVPIMEVVNLIDEALPPLLKTNYSEQLNILESRLEGTGYPMEEFHVR